MKKFKKVLALSLALAMGLSLVACSGNGDSTTASNGGNDASTEEGGSTAAAGEEGTVFNIYCWNDEFAGRMANFMPGYTADDMENPSNGGVMDDGTRVNFVVTPSDDNAYQNKLDATLPTNESAAADDKVDMFLIEADYALKYVNADVTMNVEDLGITADDMADMYQYTKDIVTSDDGAVKAVSWQATPGLFAYRRSIAKEVLGSDDPATVQESVKDWATFNATAEKMKSAGYFMLAGYDDSYRAFSNNVSQGWVVDGVVTVDPKLKEWVDQTKEFTDKGYNNKASLWSTEWAAEQGPNGKTFGFFYSTWGINFTLMGNSLADQDAEEAVGNGIYGDWAVCEGPAAYYWGGSWICGATGTDNPTLVHDIMYSMTCDPAIAKAITEETQDYTNNEPAMEEIANSDFQSDFLGGQNHIALFTEAAPKIDMSNAGPYDQGCNEEFQGAMKDYFDGTVADYDTALANFYQTIQTKYPELQVPAAE